MRQILPKILFNSLLGLVLIIIWSRFVNLNEVISKLQTANFIVVLLIFFSIAFSGAIRALRFQKILNLPGLKLKELIFLNYLSQLLSFLIPIRAGEITKGVYLSTQYKVPFAKSIIWVFIDRFLDFWMFIVIVAVLLSSTATNVPGNLIKGIIAVFVILTFLLILAIKSASSLKKIITIFLPFLIFPKLKNLFEKFSNTIIEGFEILDRTAKEWGSFTALSLLAAISDGFTWYFAFHSLNFNLTAFQAILGNALAAFTFLVPAAPGYVGSAEAASLAVFSGILGIDANLASAVAILSHILTLVSLLILGVSGLFFLKFDLNLVWIKLKGK